MVWESEVVTLIGPDGAGKKTTLRSIHGILPPRGEDSLPERGDTGRPGSRHDQKSLEIATHGYVLETGAIINAALTEKLRQNPKVREAYLGEIQPGFQNLLQFSSLRENR